MDSWRKIDNLYNDDILRPCNGYETLCTKFAFIGLTEVYEKFNLEKFKENFITVARNAIIFNISIQHINNHLYWVKLSLKDLNIKILKPEEHNTNGTPIEVIENEDNKPLFKFLYSETKDKSKLTFWISHLLTDGKGFFSLYENIRKIIEITLEEELYNFDINIKLQPIIDVFKNRENELDTFDLKKEFFTGITEEEYKMEPVFWSPINDSIFPKLLNPTLYISKTIEKPYIPIKKYCKKFSISPQAILMAIRTKATKKYYNLPNEYKLSTAIPFSTRTTKFAKDKFKNSLFFSSGISMTAEMDGKETIDDEINECYKQLKLAFNKPTACIALGKFSDAVNKDTLNFTDPKIICSCGFHSVSHIGRFSQGIALDSALCLSMECSTNYYVTIYGYHTDDKFYYTLFYPELIEYSYIESIIKEIDVITEHLINCE